MKCLILLAFGVLALCKAQESFLIQEFVNGYNRYSTGVYKKLLRSTSGNFLVCPLSVEILFGVLVNGAKGRTAQEIYNIFGLPENPYRVNQIFQTLAPSLRSRGDNELISANKVYIKDDFEISDNFRNTAENIYKAETENINFERNVQAAANINRWVEDRTHNKIKDLIKSDDLDQFTRVVLVNAIYFHANWRTPFKERLTRKQPFFLDPQYSIETHMMESFGKYNYYESQDLNAKFLELPYEGGHLSMHIALPNERDGLAALEANIGSTLVTPKYNLEKVHVTLPKFKMESLIKFKPILKDLGLELAFDDGADFSGIGAQRQNLTVSKVVQKTFIEVNEEGTTAAAGSGVLVAVPVSLPINPEIPRIFKADHPFIYYLRINNGVNLFIGRYVSPN